MVLASRKYYASLMHALVHITQFLGSFIIFGLVIGSSIVGPQFLSPTANAVPSVHHSLQRIRAAFILGVIALSLLIIGFIISSHALADYESKMYREGEARKRGYVGAPVEGPSLNAIFAFITVGGGVATVLASVLCSIAAAVDDSNGTFIACAVILGSAVVVAAILTIFYLLSRNEANTYGMPPEVQVSRPVLTGTTNNNYAAPYAGAP